MEFLVSLPDRLYRYLHISPHIGSSKHIKKNSGRQNVLLYFFHAFKKDIFFKKSFKDYFTQKFVELVKLVFFGLVAFLL